MKVRFIEPGNRPYRPSLLNYVVYDRYIRTPSVGLNTLATIVKREVDDTLMYSESISRIPLKDVLDADVIFIGIFTFAAVRGYQIARYLKKRSKAVIVMGGLHASLNYKEAVHYCDYVLMGEGDETILTFLRAIKQQNINIIPDRNLVWRYQKMAGHNTIWPQVHASRGCPHNCDYCALVRHFGHKVRTRTPENVVEDIRQSIEFFDKKHFRPVKDLWITDDNFFADREWAVSVLNAIIDSGIRYRFNVQARYEVGFDDEILELLKKAGFFELDMGIEFIDDKSFETYHKKSTKEEIVRSIRNIQRHGLSVRGLFILGSDDQEKGVGDQLADFVIENNIQGVLIQSMYFVPGTPVYETHRDRLLHLNWSLYNGNTVHYPKNMTPYELQLEHIIASKKIYSVKRLIRALFCEDYVHKFLFLGEFLWHMSVRADLKRQLPYLKKISERSKKRKASK